MQNALRGFDVVGSFVPGSLFVSMFWLAFAGDDLSSGLAVSIPVGGYVVLAALSILCGHTLSLLASIPAWHALGLTPWQPHAVPTMKAALDSGFAPRIYGMATVARLFGASGLASASIGFLSWVWPRMTMAVGIVGISGITLLATALLWLVLSQLMWWYFGLWVADSETRPGEAEGGGEEAAA